MLPTATLLGMPTALSTIAVKLYAPAAAISVTALANGGTTKIRGAPS